MMQIVNFRPVSKGFVIGFFDISIPAWGGLEIKECRLFQKDDKRWITMPNRSYDNEDGKKVFVPYIRFNEETAKKIRDKALEQINSLSINPEEPQEEFLF